MSTVFGPGPERVIVWVAPAALAGSRSAVAMMPRANRLPRMAQFVTDSFPHCNNLSSNGTPSPIGGTRREARELPRRAPGRGVHDERAGAQHGRERGVDARRSGGARGRGL